MSLAAFPEIPCACKDWRTHATQLVEGCDWPLEGVIALKDRKEVGVQGRSTGGAIDMCSMLGYQAWVGHSGVTRINLPPSALRFTRQRIRQKGETDNSSRLTSSVETHPWLTPLGPVSNCKIGEVWQFKWSSKRSSMQGPRICFRERKISGQSFQLLESRKLHDSQSAETFRLPAMCSALMKILHVKAHSIEQEPDWREPTNESHLNGWDKPPQKYCPCVGTHEHTTDFS